MVLASELLAIRQLIPFVGSGTETVAILVSAVLLPLAIGYHQGGRAPVHIRRRLIRNLLIALGYLTLALSYPVLELFFTLLDRAGLHHPIAQTACYALLLLVVPIYLLGQTVPLISNYFHRQRISELTGRMLFFSTVGSFLGSVFSTLVLMNTIGVHATVSATLALLVLLVAVLARRTPGAAGMGALCILLLTLLLNSPATLRAFRIVSNNSYNTVSVHATPEGGRLLRINRSPSSALTKEGTSAFPYITYVESTFVAPLAAARGRPGTVLVIGAGGFTLGLKDTANRFTFVDIDPALKQIAEQHFLSAPLGHNKTFIAQSARAFVRREHARYDLIFIDTFTNVFSAPMETITQEFLADAKKLLTADGILIVNQVARPDLSDRFSLRYDRTFARVFGAYTRQVIGDYNPWAHDTTTAALRNILYIYYARAETTDPTYYSDDLNSYSLDRAHQ